MPENQNPPAGTDRTETPRPQNPAYERPGPGPIEKQGGRTSPPNAPQPLRSIDIPAPPPAAPAAQPAPQPHTTAAPSAPVSESDN